MISYVTIAKEAWQILETTYGGMKKVKDTKLQMLTTRFEELKMSEDDFRAKVTAIEESKDLDDIKVQELIGSLQTYELSLLSQRKSKSLALKTINERVEAHDTSDEDEFKKNGKFAEKGKFPSFGKEKKDFKRKDGKESQFSQGITCFECNGHGHLKKECHNYLRGKSKVYATILSDTNSSGSDSDESCDREGSFSAFMTIAPVESLDDLSVLVEELGEHTEVELMGVVEESNVEDDERTMGLQETYNSLIEKSGEYARVAKATIKKIKKAKEDYRSLLVRYKETKCEMETLNRELTKVYSKIKFLELEVIQANAKVEQVSSKKLDEVLAHQKPFSNKSGLGHTSESSSSVKVSKVMKFVKAQEPVVETSVVEKVKPEKKQNVTNQRFLTKPPNQSVIKPKAQGKSLPKSQRVPRTQHFYHHCGI
ncbi:uncharacterized protein LOC136065238 [Quercus suber]|uniref:uncharacterized protein LOC136065238 n=1 Tax=Quercus suber TaxID=58331 RepID=UPI0032E007FC